MVGGLLSNGLSKGGTEPATEDKSEKCKQEASRGRSSPSDSLTEICLAYKNLAILPSEHVLKLNPEKNMLDIFPEKILNMHELEYLNLAFNNLSTLPEDIKNLSSLKILSIKGNNLKELPESFGNLHRLVELNASCNKLISVPVSLGHLRNLSVVDLSHNCLPSLPLALNCLECLTLLDVSHNSILMLESRPRWLKNICVLRLDHNLMKDLPDWLYDASRLTELSFSHNPLLPQQNEDRLRLPHAKTDQSFQHSNSRLQSLDMRNCGIKTPVPPQLSIMRELVELHLGNTSPPPFPDKDSEVRYNVLLELPPGLPAYLGRSLQVLDLRHLQLCGLPRDLAPLQTLRVLLLRGNPLMWLPDSFSQLKSLETCDLSICQLIELPMQLGNLTALTSLSLANNKLGMLPQSMKALTSLKFLDLYDNRIDALPDFLMTLPSLQALDLGYNSFSPEDQLQPAVLQCYQDMKKKLRCSVKDVVRLDSLQVDAEYFNSSTSSFHSPSDNSDCDSGEFDFEQPILENVDDFQISSLVADLNENENWDESDNDDNYDPNITTARGRVMETSWPTPLTTEHYFCPADSHAPCTKRAARHRLLPEPGQFDDADSTCEPIDYSNSLTINTQC